MSEHMQQTMPDHLKKFQGGYIPQHVEKAMNEHMAKSLPKHMQQYAGAYMQQQVLDQAAPAVPPPSGSGTQPAPRAQEPHHSWRPSFKKDVPESPTGPKENYEPAPGQDPASGEGPYSFITNPKQPGKQSPLAGLPGGNSTAGRAGVVAAGLVILLIAFFVFRGLLNSSPDYNSFISIAQQQQEMIHLAENAQKQADLSTGNRGLAATMQLSLGSSQSKTIKYLAVNKQKINTKVLNLRVSAATDKQLADAAAATTYNETFRDIMQTRLNAYMNNLDVTFKNNGGKNGRELLKDSYYQAQLMQTQLSSAGEQ